MRHAARTDANQDAICLALRRAGASVWVIGLPVDLLVGFRGRTYLIEVKTTVGKRVIKAARHTPLQTGFLATWRGGPALTVTSAEEALAAIGAVAG